MTTVAEASAAAVVATVTVMHAFGVSGEAVAEGGVAVVVKRMMGLLVVVMMMMMQVRQFLLQQSVAVVVCAGKGARQTPRSTGAFCCRERRDCRACAGCSPRG